MAKVTAISSIGWAHYTLYQALPKMACMGFGQIEIASFERYCFHFNFGSPTAPELKQMLQSHGLTPIGLNYSRGRCDASDPDQIDVFVSDWTHKLEQLPEVGIPMMTMVFGERNQRPDQEDQLANVVRAYDRVGRVAERYGVRMLMEVPNVYTAMPRPEQVYWVLDRLDCDNVGVLIDSSHWGVIGYDIDELVGRVGDRLWHVHLRDSRGQDTADRLQELELTAGCGTVDFRKFGRALDAVGYSGDVSLEFEYRDMTLEEIDHEFEVGLRHLVDCGWGIPEGVKI